MGKAHTRTYGKRSRRDWLERWLVCPAQLDPIYGAGYVDPNLGSVEQPVIDELRELFSLVDPSVFKVRTFCALIL